MSSLISPHREGVKVGGIYISGPMRGYPELNFPAFFEAEAQLRASGVTVPIFNPARHDRDNDLANNRTFRQLIVMDIVIMADSRFGLILLEGWKESKGVDYELTAARFLGTPSIELSTAISNGPEFVNNLFGDKNVQ